MEMETKTEEERNSLRERHTDLQRQRWRKTIGSLRERWLYRPRDTEIQRERDKKRGRETESQRPREKRDRERGERGWDRDG